jgi:hypothetical protein
MIPNIAPEPPHSVCVTQIKELIKELEAFPSPLPSTQPLDTYTPHLPFLFLHTPGWAPLPPKNETEFPVGHPLDFIAHVRTMIISTTRKSQQHVTQS